MLLGGTLAADEDQPLLAISCACGRTLISISERGLVSQVTAHWRLRHAEPIAVTPAEFVRRHAFTAWEVD